MRRVGGIGEKIKSGWRYSAEEKRHADIETSISLRRASEKACKPAF